MLKSKKHQKVQQHPKLNRMLIVKLQWQDLIFESAKFSRLRNILTQIRCMWKKLMLEELKLGLLLVDWSSTYLLRRCRFVQSPHLTFSICSISPVIFQSDCCFWTEPYGLCSLQLEAGENEGCYVPRNGSCRFQ